MPLQIPSGDWQNVGGGWHEFVVYRESVARIQPRGNEFDAYQLTAHGRRFLGTYPTMPDAMRGVIDQLTRIVADVSDLAEPSSDS